jgi:hypothetical protein
MSEQDEQPVTDGGGSVHCAIEERNERRREIGRAGHSWRLVYADQTCEKIIRRFPALEFDQL